ncbi:MAG: hypothetical protein ACTHNL_01280 [Devosia sp.]
MTAITFRRLSKVAALVLFAVAFANSASYAKSVQIHGTHSKDEIQKACDAVADGVPVQGSKGGGYGCVNTKKGTMVACNNQGVCTGYVPD